MITLGVGFHYHPFQFVRLDQVGFQSVRLVLLPQF